MSNNSNNNTDSIAIRLIPPTDTIIDPSASPISTAGSVSAVLSTDLPASPSRIILDSPSIAASIDPVSELDFNQARRSSTSEIILEISIHEDHPALTIPTAGAAAAHHSAVPSQSFIIPQFHSSAIAANGDSIDLTNHARSNSVSVNSSIPLVPDHQRRSSTSTDKKYKFPVVRRSSVESAIAAANQRRESIDNERKQRIGSIAEGTPVPAASDSTAAADKVSLHQRRRSSLKGPLRLSSSPRSNSTASVNFAGTSINIDTLQSEPVEQKIYHTTSGSADASPALLEVDSPIKPHVGIPTAEFKPELGRSNSFSIVPSIANAKKHQSLPNSIEMPSTTVSVRDPDTGKVQLIKVSRRVSVGGTVSTVSKLIRKPTVNYWQLAYKFIRRNISTEFIGPCSYRAAVPIYQFLNNKYWMILSFILTIIALFASDFTYAVLPKSVDNVTNIILTITFALLLLEILLMSAVQTGYINSFYFYLDLIGTISLIFDIPYFNVSLDNTNSVSTTFGLLSDSTSVIRATSTIRFTRVARIFRVARLVRVVRVFKFLFNRLNASKSQIDYNNNTDHSSNTVESKVGQLLTERTNRTLIVMILLVLLVFPLLESPTDDATLAKSFIIASMSRLTNSTELLSMANNFYSYYGSDIVLLRVNSINIHSADSDTISKLRAIEIDSYSVLSSNSAVWFNIHNELVLQSTYNMVLILCVIIIYTVGVYIINRDASNLVVKPIERMVVMIKKLAGSIAILSINDQDPDGDSKQGSGSNSATANNSSPATPTSASKAKSKAAGGGFDINNINNKLNSAVGLVRRTDPHTIGLEMQLIEELVDKMSEIFKVQPGKNTTDNKSIRVLTGHKHTEIKTRDTIVSIDVSERPIRNNLHSIRAMASAAKLSDISGKSSAALQLAASAGLGIGNKSNTLRNELKLIDYSLYPELTSIDSILYHSLALEHFRHFLTSKFSVECLQFYLEVRKFKSKIRQTVSRLIKMYIRAGSVQEINIQADMRTEIEMNESDPNLHIFDLAEREMRRLMETSLLEFKTSQGMELYCRVKSKSQLSAVKASGALLDGNTDNNNENNTNQWQINPENENDNTNTGDRRRGSTIPSEIRY